MTAVHIRLCALSGVAKEALLTAFDLACEGTPLMGARLVVEEVPIIAWCPTCRDKRPVASAQWFCCSECDTPVREVVQGKELELTALEINDVQ